MAMSTMRLAGADEMEGVEVVDLDCDIMRATAHEAARLVKLLLPFEAKRMLEDEISPGNLHAILQSYELVLKEVQQEAGHEVEAHLRAELNSLIDDQCRVDCTTFLMEILSRLQGFKETMTARFRTAPGSMTASDLQRIGAQETLNLIQRVPPRKKKVHKLLSVGARMIIQYIRKLVEDDDSGTMKNKAFLEDLKKEVLIECRDLIWKLEKGNRFQNKPAFFKTILIRKIKRSKTSAEDPNMTLRACWSQVETLVQLGKRIRREIGYY